MTDRTVRAWSRRTEREQSIIRCGRWPRSVAPRAPRALATPIPVAAPPSPREGAHLFPTPPELVLGRPFHERRTRKQIFFSPTSCCWSSFPLNIVNLMITVKVRSGVFQRWSPGWSVKVVFGVLRSEIVSCTGVVGQCRGRLGVVGRVATPNNMSKNTFVPKML